jgi:CBS domain containing-hemolysin-like protein/mannitol/fructose-specific phosphotransferase system IIA component (Ntr-type)
MWSDLGFVLLAFGLVLANGFFVLAEFSIVKVRATRLEELARAGNRDAALARDVISRLDTYLSATQLGITLASLGLGWVGEPAFASLFERGFALVGIESAAATHSAAVVLSFLLITFLHVIAGELAPKSIAIAHPERAALFSAKPLRIVHTLLSIPLSVLEGSSRALLRLLGVPLASEEERGYSEEELRSILGASQERGGFSFHHLLLLENAFDFGGLRVKDIAVPLDKVAFLDPSRPWEENVAVIRARRLSRYPLRENGKITGVVHVKAIALEMMDGLAPDLRRGRHEPLRVPEALVLDAALRRMQTAGEHLAISVSATGEDRGIFTLEDVVEELIGDVRDEFERRKPTPFVDLLPAPTILLDPPATDRTEVIRRLVAAACAANRLPEAPVLEAVLRREREVPTSVGEGVAIPHARLPGLLEPRMAFARLAEGIEFDAPDKRPVRLVVLILSPAEEPAVQLKLLQRLAEIMQSDYLRARLLDAPTVEAVRETFRVGDASSHV